MRVAELVAEPAKVGVELVAWNEAGPDPAGDRAQLPVADQSANFVLGAAELGRKLAEGQGCGPVHARTLRRNASPSRVISEHWPSPALTHVDIGI